MAPSRPTLLFLPLIALLPACTESWPLLGPPEGTALEMGMTDGFSASLILDGLNNPSGVSFSDGGSLTVCDSGNGKVILFAAGEPTDHLTGFPTEYWKVNAEAGTKAFGLGPLSAVWLGDTLAVTNAGAKDGEETVQFYSAAGSASDVEQTNAVAQTTEESADKGEGNLTGMCAAGEDTLFVCGQGFDGKSWLLRATRSTKELVPFASADDAGVAVNSPMQARMWDDDTVLVLYSGAGGKEDGTIVAWNTESGALEGSYTLPGVKDPMGMDRIPGTNDLAVVDNNWSLTEVLPGSLVRVSLPEGDATECVVTPITSELRGPVSCSFGPDGRLYIAQLGTEFDSDKGQVIAVSGF
ncbi:MAG: hypothetical protein P8M11_09685 [Planctomycetota bacterium]|nr:hypothetical protein [Planctomycetota bacterium]MDG1984827.1 hypothetical protein [Planctomycetota bacterium]